MTRKSLSPHTRVNMIIVYLPQTAAAHAGGTESNGLSINKSEERDAAQDVTMVDKPGKGDSVDPTTVKEENNLAVVVRTENAIPVSTAEEFIHKVERTDQSDHIQTTTNEDSDSGIQIEFKDDMTIQQQNSGSESNDHAAKQESVASVHVDTKPEVVSTEEKRTDAIAESSHPEVKSNGLQRANAEAVNC